MVEKRTAGALIGGFLAAAMALPALADDNGQYHSMRRDCGDLQSAGGLEACARGIDADLRAALDEAATAIAKPSGIIEYGEVGHTVQALPQVNANLMATLQSFNFRALCTPLLDDQKSFIDAHAGAFGLDVFNHVVEDSLGCLLKGRQMTDPMGISLPGADAVGAKILKAHDAANGTAPSGRLTLQPQRP